MFVAAYFEERGAGGNPHWREYVQTLRGVYGARRDAMLAALGEHFGESARWTRPQGGLFIWATLDERIDTTDLLALARDSEGVAFVPGRAAYVDGRSGSSSMRLNFAGVPEDEIREGIRRIGSAMREQLTLLGSLSGSRAGTPASDAAARAGSSRAARKPGAAKGAEQGAAGGAQDAAEQLADVVALPRRERSPRERRRSDR